MTPQTTPEAHELRQFEYQGSPNGQQSRSVCSCGWVSNWHAEPIKAIKVGNWHLAWFAARHRASRTVEERHGGVRVHRGTCQCGWQSESTYVSGEFARRAAHSHCLAATRDAS